ncbi:hypothetical protein [Pseudoalteromonas sp. SWN166]|uniref:hypothetical protein n=1 Tax=Pseudoalteromonas sp. SWN166 TaxID=2792061 RepID=UPI0018CD04C3|nr:hypothetical protein [Pseudoalteromonas sp. SWN166]MBH0037754.1 hypothetical protein [Pseudoalteromonas sp. SWN166]
MIIKKFAFGNKSEAFVEDRFGKNLNIIFSNDNNKGKTLVIQGLMFTLGNEPIWPAGFEQAKYYFFIHFEMHNRTYKILRKKDTFTVLVDDEINILESLSDFKYYFDKNIYKLPEIVHRSFPKLVDLNLFYQLFFVGQDKRDTSSIFNSGFYNKTDFIEMLYALKGITGIELSIEQIKKIKDSLAQLRSSETKLVKEIDRFKISKTVLQNVKSSANFKFYKEQEALLKTLNNKITELRKQRNRESSRINKYYNLQAELNSLNRTISIGQVNCNDCGSTNITYKSKEVTFDVSNKQVRNSILVSVDKNIQIKKEIISRLDYEINNTQSEINKELIQVTPELRDIILFKDELENSGSLDKELDKKQKEIETLKQKLHDSSSKQQGLSVQQGQLIRTIIEVMNMAYKLIDENGIQVFDSLFTRKSINYSGSEEQEFYFAKLYAFHFIFKHEFPLIIDSFRDRELSTDKELKMIEIFESIGNQVVVTSTLKREEYESEKYESYKSSTALDYSSHRDSQILSQKYILQFNTLCTQFKIVGF